MGFGNWLKERKDKRKSEEFLINKLSEVLQKMEIPEIIDLCKNIIGSVPSDGNREPRTLEMNSGGAVLVGNGFIYFDTKLGDITN